MAQQVNVKFVDDLDGSDAAGTVSFGLDGRTYEIDLSDDNAAKLRDSLASFVAAARKRGGSRRSSATPSRAPRRLRNPDRQDVVYPAARMPRSWKRVCMSMRIFS